MGQPGREVASSTPRFYLAAVEKNRFSPRLRDKIDISPRLRDTIWEWPGDEAGKEWSRNQTLEKSKGGSGKLGGVEVYTAEC